jgi:hypothetical protein
MTNVLLAGALAALTVSAPIAHAHDSWISRHQYRDPVSGNWCCDDHDCTPLADSDVARTVGGYLVAGKYPVDHRRALASGDERYWICFNEEGKGPHDRVRNVKCFFVPIPS